jgi:hypothetical protein
MCEAPEAPEAPEASTMPSDVHGRNCKTLATRHPVRSVDERIAFAEEGHRYWVDGLAFSGPSVTTLVGQQFHGDKFDPEAVVQKNLAKWRHNASSKYHRIVKGLDDAEASAAVQQTWSDTTRLGTLLHYVAECRLNDEPPPEEDVAQVAKEYTQLQRFLADYPSLEPWRTELSLFWERPDGRIAVVGQLDALFKCRETDKLLLVDFKRVERAIDPDEYDFGRGGKGVMDGCKANNFVKYSLQLNLYAVMCAQHGLPVDACYLLQMHPTIDEYKLVQACNLESEAKAILDAL